MEELDTLERRLNKIGINIEYTGNFPWVYINKINEKIVKEKYRSEHGFVVGYMPIRWWGNLTFVELSVIFKLIRKYC